MAQVEITDQKSFEAWLKTRPAADDDILAARIGLRVLPLWGRRMEAAWATQNKLTALPILRILLIKSIAQGERDKYHRANARDDASFAASFADVFTADTAANAAAGAANAAAGAADAFAFLAAYGATAAAAARRNFWAAVSVDVSALQNGQDPSRLRHWPDAPPKWWERAMGETQAIWDKDPETWVFWRRWLDGVIAGQPLPFDLLDAVASIGESVWKAGPEAVADEIAVIERAREHKLRQTQQPPQEEPNTSLNSDQLDRAIDATQTGSEIVLNVDTGKLREEPLSDLPADHLQDALDFIRDAAEVFMVPPDGNDTYAMIRPEIALLDSGIARYHARPWQLYSLCQRVLDRVDKKIAIGDLPKNDALIDDLRGLLAKASAQLHQFDAKVRDSIAANVQFGDPQIDGAQADLLIDAADTIGQIAEDFLAEDAPEVARVLADPKATPAQRKEALLITSGRILRSYALATGRGVLKVYKGGRVVLSETAGIAKDMNEIAKAGAAISAAVYVILAILG